VELGASLNFATRDWTIVGIFDAGKTGFSSEIWGDVDQLMQAFRRPVYSSILFRLRDPAGFRNSSSASKPIPIDAGSLSGAGLLP